MKKLLAVALVVMMALSMAACAAAPQAPAATAAPAAPSEPAAPAQTQAPAAPSEPAAPAETVKLKVWGSQEDQQMLTGMIEEFKAAYPEKNYEIELGVVGEPDARARYLEDPAAAADVFAFASDQIVDLVNAGALYELSGTYKDAVVSENGAGSVNAATINDKVYAFPMTADNGYFLYYDKSKVSDEAAKSIEGILAAAKESGSKFVFDISNGWYVASFFLAAGCTVGMDESGALVCDFNNENGLKAAEAIKAMCADEGFLTGDDSVITGGMGESVCAAVTGVWNAAAIEEKLGENYAAVKLPTVKMGGVDTQLSSFAGYKLVGVSKVTANPVDAMNLAAWLTNEQNQIVRFNTRQAGPSNINAAASADVQANPALAALAAQGAFAVAQIGVPDVYWAPAEAFGALMEAKDYSSTLQEQLDAMIATMLG